jgi:antitoxin ParD1/3/4
MAAKHSLHVALTEPLVRYVGERVASGEYATASEVVRTGLRLLIERDLARTDGRDDRA